MRKTGTNRRQKPREWGRALGGTRAVTLIRCVTARSWNCCIRCVRSHALWAGWAGTTGFILWTIGVGSPKRGVLKNNICMASRPRRDGRRRVLKVGGEGEGKEGFFGSGPTVVLQTTTAQTSEAIKQVGHITTKSKRLSLPLHARLSSNRIFTLFRLQDIQYSTYFCVKTVFIQRNSSAYSEHDVITKEVRPLLC